MRDGLCSASYCLVVAGQDGWAALKTKLAVFQSNKPSGYFLFTRYSAYIPKSNLSFFFVFFYAQSERNVATWCLRLSLLTCSISDVMQLMFSNPGQFNFVQRRVEFLEWLLDFWKIHVFLHQWMNFLISCCILHTILSYLVCYPLYMLYLKLSCEYGC